MHNIIKYSQIIQMAITGKTIYILSRKRHVKEVMARIEDSLDENGWDREIKKEILTSHRFIFKSKGEIMILVDTDHLRGTDINSVIVTPMNGAFTCRINEVNTLSIYENRYVLDDREFEDPEVLSFAEIVDKALTGEPLAILCLGVQKDFIFKKIIGILDGMILTRLPEVNVLIEDCIRITTEKSSILITTNIVKTLGFGLVGCVNTPHPTKPGDEKYFRNRDRFLLDLGEEDPLRNLGKEPKFSEHDLSKEEYREYILGDVIYRISNPKTLFIKSGATTHRVLDQAGIVHCVPIPGIQGCVVRWKPRDINKPVQF